MFSVFIFHVLLNTSNYSYCLNVLIYDVNVKQIFEVKYGLSYISFKFQIPIELCLLWYSSCFPIDKAVNFICPFLLLSLNLIVAARKQHHRFPYLYSAPLSKMTKTFLAYTY